MKPVSNVYIVLIFSVAKGKRFLSYEIPYSKSFLIVRNLRDFREETIKIYFV